jgi:hypothetical protein
MPNAAGKVRVVNAFGSGAIGMMDPAVGMVTQSGTITSIDAGSGLCTLQAATAHGGRPRFYPHQLQITVATATSNGWPNGSDCVKLGHQQYVTNRNAQAEGAKGHTYLGPDNKPHTDQYA